MNYFYTFNIFYNLTSFGATSGGKKRWIPKINQCWTCHEDVDYNATAKAAVDNCKNNGKLKTCGKEDVCMVESRIRDGLTRQVSVAKYKIFPVQKKSKKFFHEDQNSMIFSK